MDNNSCKIDSLETTQLTFFTNKHSRRYSAFVNSTISPFKKTQLPKRSIEISPHSNTVIVSLFDILALRNKARMRENNSPYLNGFVT